MSILVKISKDFSPLPGARYYTDGPRSGQEFFEKVLDDKFSEALQKGEKLIVDLDDTEGYAPSFLDEAFSRLGEKYGSQRTWDNLQIISVREPDWIEYIKSYVFESKTT